MSKIVNVATSRDQKWRWIHSRLENGVDAKWVFVNAYPGNYLEKKITKPAIARVRAAVRACLEMRAGGSLLISHGPLLTYRCEQARSAIGRRGHHLAFAFNFTDLPRGGQRRRMSRAFQKVDRFVAFSRLEQELYSEWFDVPAERIEFVHWGIQDTGLLSRQNVSIPKGPYICAVGSQARDYGTLFHAMRRLPHVTCVLVAMPENLKGLAIPPNVEVRTQIPRSEVFAIISDSLFMVLPLKGAAVPCGHVTAVSAMFLGKSIVFTDSTGLSDYLRDGENGVSVPPGDVNSLVNAIANLYEQAASAEEFGRVSRQLAEQYCTEERLADAMLPLVNSLLEPRFPSCPK